MNSKGWRLGAAALAAAMLGACSPQVASLSCDDMAGKAKEGTASQAVQITEVRNLSEESRTEAEARCRGEAVLSTNETSPVYLRAYKEESSGNVMVQWSGEPITADAPAQ
jgi:hypothetical protein